MQAEKLIYFDDYEITENNHYIIKYESIDEKALQSIKNKEFLLLESIEVSMDRVSQKELEQWIDSFVYFEKFDLALNGFVNAKKGGNKPNARKINNIFSKLERSLSNYIRPATRNQLRKRVKHNSYWFYCVFNVGRGEGNLVITPNRKLYLFDGGDSNQNVGRKISNIVSIINSTLKFRIKIKDEISGFFISHPDNDHFRGVIDVINSHRLSNNCFIYYNYHAHYPKANWATALKTIDTHLASGRLSYIIEIPKRHQLNILSSLLPTLYLKTTWPYDIGKKISKKTNYNANDSSHCFYIGIDKNSLSFNLFGDIEKKGWEHNLDLPYTTLSPEFVFKPSHHGRKSGDPIVNFSRYQPVNLHVEQGLNNNRIHAEYVSSANGNIGQIYSPLAARAMLSTSSTNALVYVFRGNWLVGSCCM